MATMNALTIDIKRKVYPGRGDNIIELLKKLGSDQDEAVLEAAKRWCVPPHPGRIRGGAGYQQGYVTDQETQGR